MQLDSEVNELWELIGRVQKLADRCGYHLEIDGDTLITYECAHPNPQPSES